MLRRKAIGFKKESRLVTESPSPCHSILEAAKNTDVVTSFRVSDMMMKQADQHQLCFV